MVRYEHKVISMRIKVRDGGLNGYSERALAKWDNTLSAKANELEEEWGSQGWELWSMQIVNTEMYMLYVYSLRRPLR
jgi:hypothetical protein